MGDVCFPNAWATKALLHGMSPRPERGCAPVTGTSERMLRRRGQVNKYVQRLGDPGGTGNKAPGAP